jgi:hypothetical protein
MNGKYDICFVVRHSGLLTVLKTEQAVLSRAARLPVYTTAGSPYPTRRRHTSKVTLCCVLRVSTASSSSARAKVSGNIAERHEDNSLSSQLNYAFMNTYLG